MASGGVTALISKVSCESLGIRNPSLLDEALKEVEGLVEAFVDGSGPRKLVVHHQQELVEKESGERVPEGPFKVTVATEQLERLVGKAVYFLRKVDGPIGAKTVDADVLQERPGLP